LARLSHLALLGAAVLASCGENDTDPGPGGVTVGEAKALDEAAEMLDEQKLPEDALASPTPSASPSPDAEEPPSAEPSG
jgi:hypothetical protein